MKVGFSLFPYTTLFRSVLFVVHGSEFDDSKNLFVPSGARLDEKNLALVGHCQHQAYQDKNRAEHKQCHQCRHKIRSEEHTSELQSRPQLVCRLLLEKKN